MRGETVVPDPESYHSPLRGADKIVGSGCPPLPRLYSRPPHVAAERYRRGAGTPCYVYDAAAIRAAYATLDDAFDGYPHAIHYALKANSSLGDRPAAARARQPCRCQFARRGRCRDALRLSSRSDRLHRRRQERGGDRSRRGARAAGDQRRIAGRARSHRSARDRAERDGARRAARQSRHRREEPSAHFHRPEVQQVRRADRRGAGVVPRDVVAPRAVAGRRARAHRLADHHARSAQQGGRGGGRARARAAQRRRRAAAPRHGRRARHFLRRQPGGRSGRVRPRAGDGDARQRTEGGDRARPRAGRAGRRAVDHGSSTSNSFRARSDSSCSMRA